MISLVEISLARSSVQKEVYILNLGGGFKHCLFSPLPGQVDPT